MPLVPLLRLVGFTSISMNPLQDRRQTSGLDVGVCKDRDQFVNAIRVRSFGTKMGLADVRRERVSCMRDGIAIYFESVLLRNGTDLH